jgi:hypothetical protein
MKTRQEDGENQLLFNLSIPRELQVMARKKYIAQEEEPLSPAARLFHEPKFNVYVIAIMGCKTRINPDIIKAN